jgi:hypothetical protein
MLWSLTRRERPQKPSSRPRRGDLYKILHLNFGEFLPTFIWVVQAHILDDAHEGPRMAQNSSPLEMAVEESPLGP